MPQEGINAAGHSMLPEGGLCRLQMFRSEQNGPETRIPYAELVQHPRAWCGLPSAVGQKATKSSFQRLQDSICLAGILQLGLDFIASGSRSNGFKFQGVELERCCVFELQEELTVPSCSPVFSASQAAIRASNAETPPRSFQ